MKQRSRRSRRTRHIASLEDVERFYLGTSSTTFRGRRHRMGAFLIPNVSVGSYSFRVKALREAHISATRSSNRWFIPCKRCDEDELRLPMGLYDQNGGSRTKRFSAPAVFTGTCPDCRAEDPLRAWVDGTGMPTVGRDFSRKLSNE
jgi:hypothetical protein